MNGGDLRFHISRKTFTEDAVRFWMAELGCALRYIHKQGIVHRDVKPDNVLLDGDGHVHLADFNVASDFVPGKLLTSRSGTLSYLAPEVYSGVGYSSEVDWWSLGVIFYECIYGKRPFESRSRDALTKEILRGEAKFPVTQPPVSMACLFAISSLLEKDRSRRIGASGFETFTGNPFFEEIDFRALEQRRVEPVFKPSSDKTNFDATYDLEELLLEDAPLEARSRRQRPREQLKANASDKEIREDELHRMIETLFEPFDYTTNANPRPITESAGCVVPPAHPPEEVRPSDQLQRSEPMKSHHTTPANSGPVSPNGSPPIQAFNIGIAVGTPGATTDRSGYFAPRDTAAETATSPAARPPPPISHVGSTRNTSVGGGIQVVLDETGSWSELANRNATSLQGDASQGLKPKPSGMLGFLGRSKGREKSPKPQQRGVLGKEGARIIVNNC
ncbi:MAG: hypothetical protein M1819_001818 [Sarea resinae]|nr:MAG: hypothetical protein M1819_001818 [Sarea resinae]